MTARPALPSLHRPEDLTASWLTAALSAANVLDEGDQVSQFTVAPVGAGQMADTVRVTYQTDQRDESGRTVIAKFASADETSRATGLMTHSYAIEVGFYAEVANRVRSRIPHCHLAQIEPETPWFTLLLQDMVGSKQGEQLDGCSATEGRAALIELARLHGPCWEVAELSQLPWLNRASEAFNTFSANLLSSLWPGFVERYGDHVEPSHRQLCDTFIGVVGPWLSRAPRGSTVTHGDFRLDNLLFGPGAVGPCVVDWQTAAWGSAASDVAYFLGGSLTVEDRRRSEHSLVEAYHRELMTQGVDSYSLDQLRDDIRYFCFGGLFMTIGAAMLVKRTERGDAMFTTSLARYAQQAIDLGAEAVLPSAGGTGA